MPTNAEIIGEITAIFQKAHADAPLSKENWSAATGIVFEIKKAIKETLVSNNPIYTTKYKKIDKAEDGSENISFDAAKYARNILLSERVLRFCKATNIGQSQFIAILEALSKSEIAALSDDVTEERLASILEQISNISLQYPFEDQTSRIILKSVLSAGFRNVTQVVQPTFVTAEQIFQRDVLPSLMDYSASMPAATLIGSFVANKTIDSIPVPLSNHISAPLSRLFRIARYVGVTYACQELENYFPNAQIPCAILANQALTFLWSRRNAISNEISRMGSAFVKASQDYNDALYGYDESTEQLALRMN